MKFLRYPGGKTKLLLFLSDYLPKCSDIKGRYVEPFVGGGSVFLHLQPQEAVLSDVNQELIDLYKGIRNYPHKVWETFSLFPPGREAYYKIRDDNYTGRPQYYRAARTLYLNRTCFKGMWRHNPEGGFNVGYGGESRRWVITQENIVELSKRLKQASILHSDFEPVLDLCRDGDFIFLDPPYKPGAKELLEAHYTHGKFSFDEQVRLSKKLIAISKKRKVKWLMTNSADPEVRSLYKDFDIVEIPKGTGDKVGIYDGTSKEVVILNC
jgi:DNA adenine methylase